MRKTWLVAVLGLVACGGEQRLDVQPATAPMSAEDHLAAAQDHTQLAIAHQRAADEASAAPNATSYDCGDTVMADQVTSGGERLVNMIPCFNVEDESAAHQRELAAKERAAAAYDEKVASRMLTAEQQSCAAMPPGEMEHSAFAHRRDIAAVTPFVENGKIEGARIRFKPVRHLDVNWVRLSIACHEAQFVASGKDPALMGYDPTLVDGARVVVDPRADGGIDVTISSANDTAAAVILGRAQDLVSPTAQSAER